MVSLQETKNIFRKEPKLNLFRLVFRFISWNQEINYSIFLVRKWVAELVARLGSSLGSNPEIYKIQKGRHKQRSCQHTLAHQKIYKKYLICFGLFWCFEHVSKQRK